MQMQDLFGSVRRSLVFRTTSETNNPDLNTPPTLVNKINSCIRKSTFFSKSISSLSPSSPPLKMSPPIRWRKGELIGCGAFGRVYMGMNLDSGELLAVKQVLIAENSASKEKTQAHIKELEEEVKLLKDLSHPNIVRYLGTAREEESLNILLEFVPGGSISSLLGKFGSFPEAVIRTYTKQLLLGLEYLHKNGIMHRDIKGANILVDNKGCIKLADFGASKQVVELATVSGAKSMKGTPYWMAPEVILQTGHACSADIWSVGCTVIEMATGKPPWSQQYQEVAALFYIGTTKSHPPIPEHLSVEAKDFLLKCLQKEPNTRPTASELLKHPFVTGECGESHPLLHASVMENSEIASPSHATNLENFQTMTSPGSLDLCNLGSLSCSTVIVEKPAGVKHVRMTSNGDDDMCQLDKDDFMPGDEKVSSVLSPDDFNKSFNPMSEPSDDWRSKYGGSPEPGKRGLKPNNDQSVHMPAGHLSALGEGVNDLSFPCGPSFSEDDDELTESKIKAFLGAKALELKKLQTPLYEEFYNSLNACCSPSFVERMSDETSPNYLKLPPKSRSPSRVPLGSPSIAVDAVNTGSPGSNGKRVPNVANTSDQASQENSSPQCNDRKGLMVDGQPESCSPSMIFSEIQRKWKEELDQELERTRDAASGHGRKNIFPKGSSSESAERSDKVCISWKMRAYQNVSMPTLTGEFEYSCHEFILRYAVLLRVVK
ncbi:mitogen-activated protein kinase kinase kinase ANP1-like isoform X1 [Pistacia vera]|uniref:mitogen-activated protein kinase kinase kinase ANP1-like isoform X1 n=1 Tax=Pistacia vera TaxID=55513 RepID=UPI001262ACE1|nr:mitogen-activated protein kinase kinase kinase ANP1-like isoform X1 [Pistacia vera]